MEEFVIKNSKLIPNFLISAGVFISTMSLSGCEFHSVKDLKETIAKALEDKYDEEFICYDVWSNGGPSYFGVCSPEKNHDIRFEALFVDTGEIAYEGYYAACVAEKIEEDVQKELEDVFNDFYLHSYMTVPLYSFNETDIYAENVRNESLELDEYIQLESEIRVDPNYKASLSFVICVNASAADKTSYEEEYQTLSTIFEEINEKGINTIVYLKFVPDIVYAKCINYLEEVANINSYFDDLVRDYNIKPSNMTTNIDFEFEGDSPITITQKEYINQREEIN